MQNQIPGSGQRMQKQIGMFSNLPNKGLHQKSVTHARECWTTMWDFLACDSRPIFM